MALDFSSDRDSSGSAFGDCLADLVMPAPVAPADGALQDNDVMASLLRDVALGDVRAFTALHRHSRATLWRAAFRILQDHALAEEVVQESLIKIWQRAAQFDPSRGTAKRWVSTIARNQALDLVRQRHLAEVPLEPEIATLPEPVDSTQKILEWCDMASTLGGVERVISAMPRAMRQSVLMSCYRGYTHVEIAQELQAPVGTVKAWIRRGLQRLRLAAEAGDIPYFASA